MTAQEMLAKWDAGEIVSTIEMGGMGPGYEQAIQILVFELIRDAATLPAEGDRAGWSTWGEAAVTRCDKAVGGFSGAQVGAAKSLAAVLIRKGWEATAAQVPAERQTMVTRSFPQPPPRPSPSEGGAAR